MPFACSAGLADSGYPSGLVTAADHAPAGEAFVTDYAGRGRVGAAAFDAGIHSTFIAKHSPANRVGLVAFSTFSHMLRPVQSKTIDCK